MEKRLLVTVGDDPDSLYGVRFVSSFFRVKEDISLTLLHVAPRFEAMDEKEYMLVHEIDLMLCEIYEKKGREALDKSRAMLLHQDFPSRLISTRLIQKRHGMITDIRDEAVRGNCNAIVLGRRGYSVFEKVFHPGLSEDVLDLDFPLWICRRPERGLKNVLLCVDGSQWSPRACRHVGLMLEKEVDHAITLFYVDEGRGRKDFKESVLEPARAELMECGVSGERIGSLVSSESDVVKAIRREAEGGGYAVVALGRRGFKAEGELVSGRFMGSISLELCQRLEKASLWIGK